MKSLYKIMLAVSLASCIGPLAFIIWLLLELGHTYTGYSFTFGDTNA